jgi:hypothetical protein
MPQAQMDHNMVKSNSPKVHSTWLIFLSPYPCFPANLSSFCFQRARCSKLLRYRSICVQKATRRIEKMVHTHNRLRYFLRNKIFCLQFMYRYVRMIFIVKCITITLFSMLMQCFDGRAWFLLFCHPLQLYMILYSTGTVFLIALLSLED